MGSQGLNFKNGSPGSTWYWYQERVFDQPVLNDLVMSRQEYGFVPGLRLAYEKLSVYFLHIIAAEQNQFKNSISQ